MLKGNGLGQDPLGIPVRRALYTIRHSSIRVHGVVGMPHWVNRPAFHRGITKTVMMQYQRRFANVGMASLGTVSLAAKDELCASNVKAPRLTSIRMAWM